MKRCPKCNRTYTTQTQRFCTHDGQPLVNSEAAGADTVRIDPVLPDAPTKTISRELPSEPFDPYKTVIERPTNAAAPSQPPSDPYKTVVEPPSHATIAPPRTTQDLTPKTSAPLSGGETRTSADLPRAALETMASIPIPQPSPPPTSAPLPPQTVPGSGQLSGSPSGPIGTSASAPLTQQPVVSAPLPSQPAAVARPAKKRSKAPLVIGILAILLIFGIGAIAAAYFIVWPRVAKRMAAAAPTPAEAPRRRVAEPTPIAEEAPPNQSAAGPEQAPFVAPPNSVEFVNSKDNLDGKLAEHFVNFSFYYPKNWSKDPTAGVSGARNFVKVERRLPPDFTQENFAVGLYASTGAETRDREAYPRLMAARSAEFAKTVPGYREVSEGETKVGVYSGYELRFQGLSRDTAKGDIKIWGRVVFLPPPEGGKTGVTLLMLATSLAPELNSVEDLGEKGELPLILNSFRFGAK